MATSQTNDNNKTKDSDQNKINRIFSEFGLDPSDYSFTSIHERTSDHPSAFTRYSPPRSPIKSGRPLSYGKQPPPPPPIINRSNDMAQQGSYSRRTPPPPPTHSSPLPHDFGSHNNDPNLSAEHYLHQINSYDNPPVKVVKPNEKDLVYRKDIRIRYLQPPTPPPPAPIIIREKHTPARPPESPLLIRERKPEPHTPPPLTIRERPPTPPPTLEPCIIDKPVPPPPPPPRQIIIERLPTPPPKPRTVIFEKWLPYKKVKRPILLEKAPPPPPVNPTRNVIIEYEPLKAFTVRRVIEEGVFRVDPKQFLNYHNQLTDGDVRIVDRIDDLPPPSEELMRVLKGYDQQTMSTFNARPPSVSDQLTNVTYLSSTPSHRHERVRSPGHSSSVHNPTVVSPQHSNSKHSNDLSPKHSPHDSPK